ILRRDDAVRRSIVSGSGAAFCVPREFMRDFVCENLSQKPACVRVVKGRSGELIADINVPRADAHAENVSGGEVGKLDTVFPGLSAIARDADNGRGLVGYLALQLVIGRCGDSD